MKLKICTLSPQGNGVRTGGICRFSGALYGVGVDNFFWELYPTSWNAPFINWEGKPFKLVSQADEDDLLQKLEEYDVIINNWPTMTDNEPNSYKLWNVWKRIEKAMKITVLHNTILTAVRKENLSPLVWSASDYLLIQVSEDSTICKELLTKMPWLKGKFKQFRQILDIAEFDDRMKHSMDVTKKDDVALWVGRWENCRNTARWSTVLKDANVANFKSPFLYCAMGIESDVKSYWGFFANDKGNHVRLNSHEVKTDAAFLSAGKIDEDKLKALKEHDFLNPFYIFGRYEYKTGMDLLQKSKWGISIFGAWKDDLVNDYISLAKLEYASLEIMLLSLPIFDYRHLDSMKERELFDAPWVLKSKHDATPEENIALLKRMEEIVNDPILYREYRERNIDYVKRNHSTDNFISLIEDCYTSGKTEKKDEDSILKLIYGKPVELTNDLWVSLKHTDKQIPQYITYDEKGKIKIAQRKKLNELF